MKKQRNKNKASWFIEDGFRQRLSTYGNWNTTEYQCSPNYAYKSFRFSSSYISHNETVWPYMPPSWIMRKSPFCDLISGSIMYDIYTHNNVKRNIVSLNAWYTFLQLFLQMCLVSYTTGCESYYMFAFQFQLWRLHQCRTINRDAIART